jgi:hypothetical protein
MKAWIGVVSREHVVRGVEWGIAQLGHGKAAPLKRLSVGDWLIYYSPRTSYPDGEELRAFTAIGQVADGEVYEADQSMDFHPSRRKMNYRIDAQEAPIRPLLPYLSFSRERPNWGMVMRRGLVEITAEDLDLIAEAMRVKL